MPSAARVDPAAFPEDDFPVHCSTCGYLLNALPEPRCPECGESFDRGVLLVNEYVNAEETATRTPLGLSAAVTTAKFMVLLLIAGTVIGLFEFVGGNSGVLGKACGFATVVVIVGYGLTRLSVAIRSHRLACACQVESWKRKRVLAALEEESKPAPER